MTAQTPERPVTPDTPTREPMDEFGAHKELADVLLAHQPQTSASGSVTICACGMAFHRVDARAWHRHAAAMVENYLASLPPARPAEPTPNTHTFVPAMDGGSASCAECGESWPCAAWIEQQRVRRDDPALLRQAVVDCLPPEIVKLAEDVYAPTLGGMLMEYVAELEGQLEDRAKSAPLPSGEPTSEAPSGEGPYDPLSDAMPLIDFLMEIDPTPDSLEGKALIALADYVSAIEKQRFPLMTEEDTTAHSVRTITFAPPSPDAGRRGEVEAAKYSSGTWNNWIAPFHHCAFCGGSLNWQQSVDVFDRPLISASCACGVMYSARLGEEGLEQARAVDAGNKLAALFGVTAKEAGETK